MAFNFKDFWQKIKVLRQLQRIPQNCRSVTFYAENGSAWEHLRPVVVQLIHHYGRDVTYLTSSAKDRALTIENDRIYAFNIGTGIWRFIAFLIYKPKVFITTSPVAYKFVKHGKSDPHCIYVQDSMRSTHMHYAKGIFDHFDTIFCAGPHQANEIRKTEQLYHLNQKTLIKYGFGKLDVILQEAANNERKMQRRKSDRNHIYIAPSKNSTILNTNIAITLITKLLTKGYQVTFRAHTGGNSEYRDHIQTIRDNFGKRKNFAIDDSFNLSDAFFGADLMISDWSGMALEFAFGLECPVLYIDTPKKIANDEYKLLNIAPLEETIRKDIGEVISVNQIDKIDQLVRQMIDNRYQYIQSIIKLRNSTVFNVGNSGLYGATYINNLVTAN